MKKTLSKISIIVLILIAFLACQKENKNPADMINNNNNNIKSEDIKKDIRKQMGQQNLKEKNKKSEILFDANKSKDEQNTDMANLDNIEIANAKDLLDELEEQNKNDNGYNFDLTDMGADMIFATVYMIVTDPDAAAGKSIRVNGLLYTYPSADGNGQSQYCIIKDALQCCAQGLEISFKNKPEQIPEDGTEVLVEGVLEPYQVEGVPMKLCRIKDAVITLK